VQYFLAFFSEGAGGRAGKFKEGRKGGSMTLPC